MNFKRSCNRDPGEVVCEDFSINCATEIREGISEMTRLVADSTPGRDLLRLIVAADGELNLLPFDALTDEHGRYVLETRVVTYAPSATVLHLLRSEHSDQTPKNFLGVGGVVYSKPTAATSKSSVKPANVMNSSTEFFDVNAVTFPDLPGSKQEVMSVAAVMKTPSHILLDSNATESAVKALPIGDFGLIHFAVHAVVDRSFPDRAALVFGTSQDSLDDGLLQVREIRDLPIHAELVTLSACDTGNGRLLGEEGIASLERAFLLAGAKSVVASRWTADDTYTIALMRRFYQHLWNGMDKGAALRQAKLDLLDEFADQALPVYWAGFTLAGDGTTAIFTPKKLR